MCQCPISNGCCISKDLPGKLVMVHMPIVVVDYSDVSVTVSNDVSNEVRSPVPLNS